jgi:hypothetical protein
MSSSLGDAHPDDVGIMQSVSMSGTNEPFQRRCNFVGTVDQSDAAGNPPGFTGGRFDLRPVCPPRSERRFIALYEATDGPNWTHKFGWRGPSGTECKWHGVECEPGPEGPTIRG